MKREIQLLNNSEGFWLSSLKRCKEDIEDFGMFSKRSKLLRPTLRVIFFFFSLLLMFAIYSLLFLILYTKFKELLNWRVLSLIQPLFALSLTYLFCRFIDKRSLLDLGLKFYKGFLRDVVVGTGLGITLTTLIFLILYATGCLMIKGFIHQGNSPEKLFFSISFTLLQFFLLGLAEELIFRGYILQNLIEDWGVAVAVAASSILFGLVHAGNPNVTILSIISITLAGVLLAYGYLTTNFLWLPVALHVSWNFFEGPVFGFPVSGVSGFKLIQTKITGPNLFTGGAFGPEGGLISIFAIFVGIVSLNFFKKIGGWRKG